MTELELMIDFYKDGKRQGPGSTEDTLKALQFIHFPEDRKLKIADIGCGTGGQTLVLAQLLNGSITAVDLFPEFLAELNHRSADQDTQNKIRTLEQSMEALPFAEEELDLIWSEGAIYNIGFKRGIQEWHKFLKKGAYLAVSEVTWTSNSRPKEIEEFWMNEYPEINTAAKKIQQLEEANYQVVGYFILPENSWLKGYYKPIENRLEAFAAKHGNSQAVKKLIQEQKEEIKLYKTFKDYYSYGFYIAKKL